MRRAKTPIEPSCLGSTDKVGARFCQGPGSASVAPLQGPAAAVGLWKTPVRKLRVPVLLIDRKRPVEQQIYESSWHVMMPHETCLAA